MTSSFPRLLAAWLGVRVANRKKVRWQSIATHESGGLSPFRGHRSALNAWRYIIISGALSGGLASAGVRVGTVSTFRWTGALSPLLTT